MKNILITGGAGFIGSNLVNYFLKKKIKTTVIDDLSIGSKKNLKLANISFYKKDIIKIDQIPINKRFDALIHLAAKAEILITKEKENIYSNSNIFGLQSVLNFAASRKIKKFIFASSASIYGNTGNKKVNEETKSNPKHFYAYSKYLGEEMVKEYCKINAINFTILRYGSLYGLRTNRSNGVFKIIMDALENKKLQYVGSKQTVRKYIHVIDAAKANVNLMSSKYKNKYVNIVGDKSYKVTELLDIVSKSLKISGKVNFLNAKMMGHYIKSPKLFRLRTGINYRLKKYTKFKHGVNYLINNMKRNIKKIN